MPPKTLTKKEFLKIKPKGNYDKYLAYIKKRRDRPDAGLKPQKAPLDELGVLRDYTAPLGPRTADQLWDIAGNMAAYETEQQIQPLRSLSNLYEDKGADAVHDIGKLFDAADVVGQRSLSYATGVMKADEATQQAIFSSAQTRLQQQKQEESARAQALAQMTGVPVEMADQGIADSYLADAQGMGDIAELSALARGESAVSFAEAFAGQVLPMMRIEATTRAKTYWDDKVTQLEDEIASIRKQKGSLTNARYNELLGAEREFALQVTQANRDWWAAREAAAISAQNAATAAEQVRNDYSIQSSGLDVDRYNAETQRSQVNGVLTANRQEALTATRQSAYDMLAAIRTGNTQIKDVKTPVPVDPPADPEAPPANYYKQGNQWYMLQTRTTPLQITDPITDPEAQFDYLVANGIPKGIATQVVRSQPGVNNNWNRQTEGQFANWDKRLAALPQSKLNTLFKIASGGREMGDYIDISQAVQAILDYAESHPKFKRRVFVMLNPTGG